jgi:hypothetical protein
MPGTDSQPIKLPARPELTLCEAVTACVYGKAIPALRYMVDDETVTTEEEGNTVRLLTERLQEAAYAGRIKIRALKNGDTHADGHRDVDRLYFSESRGFRWERDEIWVCDLSPQHPKFVPNRAFRMDWHDVHLDREEFEELLRRMRVPIIDESETNAPGQRKTLRTGMPGRPTSKHLVLKMAQRRLDSGTFPPSLAAFSRELADELRNGEPGAAPMKEKTIGNAIRKLWHARQTQQNADGTS